jgi:hypothetical protein
MRHSLRTLHRPGSIGHAVPARWRFAGCYNAGMATRVQFSIRFCLALTGFVALLFGRPNIAGGMLAAALSMLIVLLPLLILRGILPPERAPDATSTSPRDEGEHSQRGRRPQPE